MSGGESSDDSTVRVRLTTGTRVGAGERWEVTRLLGEGGCGVVYEVKDTRPPHRLAALKLEPVQRHKEDEILKMEVHVLRLLQNKPHACQMLACGKTPRFNFLIMSVCGRNLADLRRTTPEQRLSTGTSLRLGAQSLDAIQHVHDVGLTHRDVKPSNFALGGDEATRRTVFLLDFGLARQFYIKDAATGRRVIREPRVDVPFRGTVRYCSPNVHQRKEQGRHDDLWSLFYMLVEMIRGRLPWRDRSKERTAEMKAALVKEPAALCKDCPPELVKVFAHLSRLDYRDKPDYALARNELSAALRRLRVTAAAPFDWEEGGRYHKHFVRDESTESERTEDERRQREQASPDTVKAAEELDESDFSSDF